MAPHAFTPKTRLKPAIRMSLLSLTAIALTGGAFTPVGDVGAVETKRVIEAIEVQAAPATPDGSPSDLGDHQAPHVEEAFFPAPLPGYKPSLPANLRLSYSLNKGDLSKEDMLPPVPQAKPTAPARTLIASPHSGAGPILASIPVPDHKPNFSDLNTAPIQLAHASIASGNSGARKTLEQNLEQKEKKRFVSPVVSTIETVSRHIVKQVQNFAWGASTNADITKEGDPEADDLNRITDEIIPWASIEQVDIPKRPSPIFELGESYFDIGPMDEGFELFTGARWRPGFMVFGQLRSALQSFENAAGNRINEWVNRLDLFANLRLTGTERVLASFRPIDQDGQFTGYDLDEGSFESRFNGDLLTLFFEGDIDQIFPNWLNPTGMENNDYGFSVGRQPVFIQEGFLINDVLDSIALANNNIHIPGLANAHATLLYAWDDVNRDDNQEAEARLWGLFSEADFRKSRVQVDLAYVQADNDNGGDGFYTGLSSFQRIGEVFTTFRIDHSIALEDENAQVSDGTLLFNEISWEPDGTNDIVYFNNFAAIDNYAQAANDVAGPLGDVGVLFAAKNIGAFGAPIANNADDAYGGALGYQHMFNNFRSQIIGELAYRVDNEPEHSVTTAAGLSYEQAFGRRTQLFIDAFAARNSDQDELITGIRTELSIKF